MLPYTPYGSSIFLGGTIDMGNSADWQQFTADQFNDEIYEDLVFYNPRRPDWDSSWEQDPTRGTPFYEQVMWEMAAQEEAQFKLYHFEPSSMSPVTLLEVGRWATSFDTVVSCNPNYYRYGNVRLFCEHHDIMFFDVLYDAITELKEHFI